MQIKEMVNLIKQIGQKYCMNTVGYGKSLLQSCSLTIFLPNPYEIEMCDVREIDYLKNTDNLLS